VRDLLRRHGFDSRRGIQSAGEADITHDVPGYHIEVKNQEALNIWAALEQAERDAHARDEEALVFFKRNKSRLYMALDAERGVELLRLQAIVGEFIELLERKAT
jgi:hypothetical protein